MKPGPVVSIRLNTQDVMACIDIIDAAGVYVQGMSLSQCVKTAFEGLIQAARQHGGIPERTGYEYSGMVQRFTGVSQARKRAVTDVMEGVSMERIVRDLPHALAKNVKFDAMPTPFELKKSRVLMRLTELGEKKRADVENWTEPEQQQLDRFQTAYHQLDEGIDVDTAALFGGMS